MSENHQETSEQYAVLLAAIEKVDRRLALLEHPTSVFEHNGHPDLKQEAEIYTHISLAIGFCTGAIAAFKKAFEKFPTEIEPYWVGTFILLLLPAYRAVMISYRAIKGRAPGWSEVSSKIVAWGILAIPIALTLGVILALAIS